MALFSNFKNKHRKILHGCQLLSLVIHVVTIATIHILSFKPPNSSETPPEIGAHIKNSDEVLKEVFEKLAIKKGEVKREPTQEIFDPQNVVIDEKIPPADDLPGFMNNDLLEKIEKYQTIGLLARFQDWEQAIFKAAEMRDHSDLIKEIDKISLYPEKREEPKIPSHLCYEDLKDFIPEDLLDSPYSLQDESKPVPYHANSSALLEKDTAYSASDPFSPSSPPEAPRLPTLSKLNTLSCAEDFDIDLVYLKQEKKDGYIFALTLIPKPNVQFEKLKHNIYFVIDKSNAIQNDRLKTTQSAIYRSLSYLHETDSFNLLAFDTGLERMSVENLSPNKKGKNAAKAFLNHLRLGSLFTTADPYKPLNSLLYEIIEPEDLSSIILISNGEGLSNKNNPAYFLQNFTARNGGKFNLFGVAMNNDKNLSILEALISFNKGKLYLSPTRGGVKRKLMKLVKSISYPIAKDLSLTPIAVSPDSKIQLFPSHNRISALYLGQPFIILGHADSLDDFVVFIQGRQNDKWLNIKKKISFSRARKADSYLEEEWALQRSYDMYETFFRDGDPGHLIEAKELLEPYKIPSLF